uniref:NADH-ubiquinone oxidoreductase chain 6 n=1 Tax=Leptogium hirsutum TaxID=1486872 RepID=A0A1X9QGY8_9LECA|nr:NADH dehydrogenase subunit 6 [Leptogium hirsutum]ARQ27109.1 NADH dehydrogenase subunit 6 [Leptogium hirsutum]
MINLSVMHEIFTNGYKPGMLNFFFICSLLSSIFVIISVNPIVSILFLIGLFLSIAMCLIIFGISFIALSYLLVYVGAVSILFVFILMLINVRISELLSNTSNSIALAAIIAISISYPINQVLFKNIAISNYDNLNLKNLFNGVLSNSNFTNLIFINKLKYISNDNSTLFLVTSNIWDGNLWESIHITSIGNIMYTGYMILLIITSVILLLAMVGGIVITIKQKS